MIDPDDEQLWVRAQLVRLDERIVRLDNMVAGMMVLLKAINTSVTVWPMHA